MKKVLLNPSQNDLSFIDKINNYSRCNDSILKLKKTIFCFAILLTSYVSNSQCAYSGTPLTQVGSDYTFCVDNATTYTTATVNSGQYVVVNVVKGFTYTFSVGNVFTANENLTILDASTNSNVSPSKYASGSSGATISNWVSTLTGKIKILLSRGSCSNGNVTGGAITLTLNAVGNTQDSQTAYGTDQWVAHVYNWTGTAPPGGTSPTTPSTTTSPFVSANYVGYYNVTTESISDTFGGDYNCFPVYSNGVVSTNMYTEQFAIRYRMRSTKIGCYLLSTSGDDGVRVYVDGVKVYDEWKEQSQTSYTNILLYLNGNSDIIFDYYENAGNNINSLSLTPFNSSSNTIAQSSLTVCSGVSPGVLNGSSYPYTGSSTNPTISFQWQSSTDNTTFTNISGATLEDYTPPTQTTTTTNVVRYYRRVVTAVASTASGCSYISNVTTVTTSSSIPSTPSTVSGTVNQCQSLTNQIYSISSVTNATSYNWTVPTGWTIIGGAGTNSITVTTGTVGQNGNISVVAVNGCGISSAKTLAVTVNSNSTVGVASSSPTLCINTGLTSITHTTTGTTGIGTATGLPTGVTANWSSNTITISGTPTVSGTFAYSIPLTGGCGSVSATGTITVTPVNTVSTASSSPTVCVNTAITAITHTTTGATGIGTATGLPTGVTANWSSNTITINGTPTTSGIFNYSIPLTGGCGTVTATGTINVNNLAVGGTLSGSANVCSNSNTTTLTLSGYTGTISKWQSSTSSSFSSGVTDISNTNNTYTVYYISTTTYYRAVITSGSCSTSYSSVASITVTANPSGNFAYSSYGFCNSINTVQNVSTSNFTGVAGTYSSSAGLSLNSTTGAILPSQSTVSSNAYTVTYTIPAFGGCPSYSTTTLVTIEGVGTGTISYAPTTICQGTTGTVSPIITGAGGSGSSTWVSATPTGLTIDGTGVITPSTSMTGTFTVTYNRSASALCAAYSNSTTVTISPSGTIVLSSATGTNSQTKCINTSITNITYSTTVATGATFTGLPAGVSGTWSSNTVTISGTPTLAGTYNFTVALTGVCTTVSATGTIVVNPNLSASVSIAASSSTICSGTNVTFTATPTNGGSTPSYQWKLNGVNISGATGVTYSKSNLANNDIITVIMTSNISTCLSGSPATSNTITMTVSSPSVGGTVSGSTTVCSAINSTTLTLTGNTGAVTKWQSSSVSNFASAIIDIANTSNSLIVTNLSSTLYYRAVVANSGCSTSNSSIASIQYGVPVGINSITPLVSQLSGNATTTITANGVVGVNPVVSWYTSSGQVGFLGTGLTSPAVGIGTYYAVVTGSCGSSVELSTIIRGLNNWTGAVNTAWSIPGNWSENIVPDATMDVTIGTGKVAEINSDDAVANNITIVGTGTLTVKSGKNLTLTTGFTTESASSLVLENNANLIQLSSTANTTSITVKRDTNALIRLDYTMWSSPVIGQKLLSFSPLTSISPTVRFYTYNTSTNSYNSVSSPSTTDFEGGKGYLIRLPYNHPTAPTVWSGSFAGIPGNGTKTVTLSNIDENHQYNIVGNPYPSPISVSQFMLDNASKIEPTIYFWRKTNNAAKPSYCTWNSTSQTFSSNGEAFSVSPNGIIQTGQGFIVEAKGNATSLEFNNGQRIKNNVSHFFKSTNTTATNSTESHRIWLNLTGATTEYSQAVIGYFTNATQGADDYDSKLFNDGSVSLSMKIGALDYAIQGRPAPFDASDIVPLNYKVTSAGSYTISIDHVDGLFAGGSQNIFLRDNVLGTCNNLSISAYTFTSNSGSFDSRFELLFQNNLLSNSSVPEFNENEVVVYHQKSDLIINSGVATMSTIKIFNIKGALLFDKKEINASETKIDIGSTNEVLLVEIVTTDGVKVVKKVYSELVIGSDDDE